MKKWPTLTEYSLGRKQQTLTKPKRNADFRVKTKGLCMFI